MDTPRQWNSVSDIAMWFLFTDFYHVDCTRNTVYKGIRKRLRVDMSVYFQNDSIINIFILIFFVQSKIWLPVICPTFHIYMALNLPLDVILVMKVSWVFFFYFLSKAYLFDGIFMEYNVKWLLMYALIEINIMAPWGVIWILEARKAHWIRYINVIQYPREHMEVLVRLKKCINHKGLILAIF